MQNSCLLLPHPNSFFFPSPTPVHFPLHYNTPKPSTLSNLHTISPFHHPLSSRHSLHPLQSLSESVLDTIIETNTNEFVEVGYICKVHGIQGELRVKPNTDFPELRFAQPGRRWLKEQIAGKDVIREVELIEGRDHPGQKSWIVSFSGVDTVDKAKQLIGSTLLVKEDDRPILDEGEIYTRDLVGMKVILKDTDELIGTVVNVFNSGGPNDLLQVELNSEEKLRDGSSSLESGQDASGHLAWIPFVEAIVPDVDMDKREMKITPPKGLLELNVRSDARSKKDRRKLEWKERKKATRRLIVAKKKLIEMDQKHIFHGLRFGEKSERSLLADHIVGINFKLFQQALQNFETVSTRQNLTEFVNTYSTTILENTIKISEEGPSTSGGNGKMDGMKKKGLSLISEGKTAVVLVMDGQTNFGSAENPFTKMEEDRGLLPLVVISSSHETQIMQNTFLNNDYFGFDADKVWLLEEENLPVVSSSVNEENKRTVLMKSPWEILQSPVGSGGVFSLLSTHNIVENLSEMGVEYVQVCSFGEKSVLGNPLLLGFVESRKAEVGVKISKSVEDSFDMIFSVEALKKLVNQTDKLKFHAITEQNNHVEFVDKDFVDVVPTEPNSCEFHCSIYSSLSTCNPDKVCVMEVEG